jgi:serine/threonine-protein kinase
VYALGAMLYEMLAGEPPHTGATSQAVIAKLMTERPTPLRVIRDTVPVPVDAAVARALAKTPADRFATAGAFTRALAERADVVPSPASRLRRFAIPAGAIACVALAGVYGWGRVRPAGAPTGSAPIHLAVLPFESIGDSSDPAFGDGMSEAILERLAKVPRLSLMGRASVLRYRASGRTAVEFAEQLGVEYVLDGTVRWGAAPGGGRQVRISPELIKVDDGTRVWGEPYEGLLANVFELQADVAERVATALRGALGGGEQVLVRGSPTSDVEAYRAYLLGRQVLGTRWWAAGEAAKRFEEAIARDTNFARAYAGLAVAYSLVWDLGDRSLPRDTVYARARAAARRALALDSTLSEAHTALGRLLDAADWNWRAAGVEFGRALALDSTDAAARQWYVMHLLGIGRTADAVTEASTALRLDPLTPLTINALGLALWCDGKVDSAAKVFTGSMEWDSTGSVAGNLMGLYMAEGRAREADELVRRWPRRVSGGSGPLIAQARAGRPVKAEALRKLKEEFTAKAGVDLREPSYTILAGNYALLGERDLALGALERAEADHEERLIVALKAWPALASVRGEPRYQALVRRMGLPE